MSNSNFISDANELANEFGTSSADLTHLLKLTCKNITLTEWNDLITRYGKTVADTVRVYEFLKDLGTALDEAFDALSYSVNTNYLTVNNNAEIKNNLKVLQNLYVTYRAEVGTLAATTAYIYGNLTSAGTVQAKKLELKSVYDSNGVALQYGDADIEGRLKVGESATVSEDLTVNRNLNVNNGKISSKSVTASTNISAPNVSVSNSADIKNATVKEASVEILRVSGNTVVTDLNAGSVQADNVSAMGDITSESSVKAGEIESYGDLTVGGNLIVKGTTSTIDSETLTVKDNIIVTNSEGASFSVSGIVINTGKTYGDGDPEYEDSDKDSLVYYGVVYVPGDDAVCVGRGYVNDGEFTFKESVQNIYGNDVLVSEAVPLAARRGDFEQGEVPVWDTTYNAFVPSMAKAQQILDNEATIKTLSIELQDLRMSQKGTPGVVYSLLPSNPPQYFVAGIHRDVTDPTELEELVFADYINNIPVTRIITGAFEMENFYNLKKVVIPSTVTEIEPYAFMFASGSGECVDIVLNTGLRTIGESAFTGFCNFGTVRVNIPSTVGYIGGEAFPRYSTRLAFESPYNWAGIKVSCSDVPIDLAPSDLADLSNSWDSWQTYDYIYNRIWEEDPYYD